MPIGTSDGETFDSKWEYTMSALAPRTQNFETGKEMLRKEYLNSVIDPLFPGDLPTERTRYDDSPTPRAAGRERNLTKHLQNLEQDMELRQYMMEDSYDIGGTSTWTREPRPENIGEVIDIKPLLIDKAIKQGEQTPAQQTQSTLNRATGRNSVVPLKIGYIGSGDDIPMDAPITWDRARQGLSGDLEFFSGPEEQVEGNPKYSQNLTQGGMRSETEARWGKAVRSLADALEGKEVTTEDLAEMIASNNDIANGVRTLVDWYRAATGKVHSYPKSGRIKLPPNET